MKLQEANPEQFDAVLVPGGSLNADPLTDVPIADLKRCLPFRFSNESPVVASCELLFVCGGCL